MPIYINYISYEKKKKEKLTVRAMKSIEVCDKMIYANVINNVIDTPT